MSAAVELLARLPMFRGLAPEALEELLRLGKLRHYRAHTVVFSQGEVADGATLLLQGRLAVLVRTDRDTDHPVGWVHPGEVAGEQGLFVSGGVRNATVRAAQDSLCLDLTLRLLQEGRSSPALAALEQHLIAALARRIRGTNLAIQRAWKEQAQQEAATQAELPQPTLRDRLRALLGGTGP